ncbi:cytochrome-c peroxidase [Geminicoccus roseus]|uniref:cytochrome-c peroxidase n=1 Tax=Geminicoccus roseus TaxID=404900 RepID=UPI00041B729C|nr:cytochrome c peroxidase [Geminicoccus roseus]
MLTKQHVKSVILASMTTMPLTLWTAGAGALEPIEALGKNIFFDEKLSIPANKQACASCHDPARGWILPDSRINATTVVAPGAKPHALGNIKPPANAYASFSPPFRRGNFGPFVVGWEGGNFWDGRAEGCGAKSGAKCPTTTGGAASETIRLSDLPSGLQAAYRKYLGPIADQALNPFPNDVEQNIREKNVCQRVKTAKYKNLYRQAFGGNIDCSPNPKNNPAYRGSFKLLAVALAAWQSSSDVNSFSSKRDKALAADPDHKFPLVGFTDQENQGHDLFYGITSALNPSGKRANCNVCHNGVPQGQPPDRTGEAPHQLYADNRFHNIGVPFNREIPEVGKGTKVGLKAHVSSVPAGNFRTPTVRNVAKGLHGGFVKAFAHNGWFKSLESLVHFYNTRDVLQRCESLGIVHATEKEALKNNCWPASEFANPAAFVIGNLRLTAAEEAALVAYLKTLTDTHTPTRP